MTERFSEAELIETIDLLTPERLAAFVEAEYVLPIHTATGPRYRRVDIVRVELLCELSEHYDMDTEALGIVISLIDRLHGLRADFDAVMAAVEREPQEVRARIGSVLRQDATE